MILRDGMGFVLRDLMVVDFRDGMDVVLKDGIGGFKRWYGLWMWY